MTTDPKILVIVPAFNAAQYLPRLIGEISSTFPLENILIVDDGSTDKTAEVIEDIACRALTFSRNKGKGAALKAGFDFARSNGYDAVITIDADLQHSPDHLSEFKKLYERADIIIGTRTISPALMPLHRMLSNNLTSLIISIMGAMRIRDSQSGYRLIKTAVLDNLRLSADRYDTESQLLFQTGFLGYKTSEVAIKTIYEGSHSFINPLKDTTRFIRQIWKRLWY